MYNEDVHVVIGPGAQKGLDALFHLDSMKEPRCKHSKHINSNSIKNLASEEEEDIEPEKMGMTVACARFLRDTSNLWFSQFDISGIDRDINLMAVENCLCEIFKYLRVF